MKIFIFAMLICCQNLFANEQVIVIYADDSYPPYSYKQGDFVVGIYPDIIHAISDKLPEYKIKVLPIPWKRGLSILEKGEAFAIVPPYKRSNERPFLDYTKPILEERMAIFCNRDVDPIPKKFPKDFRKLLIGTNAGFIPTKKFVNFVKDGTLNVDSVGGSKENLLKLVSGRIDCYLNDRISILWEVKRLARQNRLVSIDRIVEVAVLQKEYGYLGMTNRNSYRYMYKQDFTKKFNLKLEEIRKSGQIEKILKYYLK